MNYYTKAIIILLSGILIVTIVASGWWCYRIGYNNGYEASCKELPSNVLDISGIDISKNSEGFYEFTVYSGNATFRIAEIPDTLQGNDYER